MLRLRVRDIGLVLGTLSPGRYNAITDVPGVGVGHCTLIEGDEIRTGVTAITPHNGNLFEEKVTAAIDVFNGYGKSVGLSQIVFEGSIESPIMLTETLNVYRVADAVLDYVVERMRFKPWSFNAVVGETNGGYLTDNFMRSVSREHVFEAIDIARSSEGMGIVMEGNVGGGTSMTGYGFKGGIGTSSRVVGNSVVGVLVQLNCGSKEDLTIGGVSVGRKVKLPERPPSSLGNSIMMIVATNVVVESRQLWKIAKRTALGLARTGSISGNTSGDFTIAFSTGSLTTEEFKKSIPALRDAKGDSFLTPLYRATVESTEEAVLNALFMADTMTGVGGHVRYALPLDQTRKILEENNRL